MSVSTISPTPDPTPSSSFPIYLFICIGEGSDALHRIHIGHAVGVLYRVGVYCMLSRTVRKSLMSFHQMNGRCYKALPTHPPTHTPDFSIMAGSHWSMSRPTSYNSMEKVSGDHFLFKRKRCLISAGKFSSDVKTR